MERILGRPAAKALEQAPEDARPEIVETAAPAREGRPQREGVQRVVRCRGNVWVVARFSDDLPREKEEP